MRFQQFLIAFNLAAVFFFVPLSNVYGLDLYPPHLGFQCQLEVKKEIPDLKWNNPGGDWNPAWIFSGGSSQLVSSFFNPPPPIYKPQNGEARTGIGDLQYP